MIENAEGKISSKSHASSASVFFDGLRAVAALLVCVDHWRNLFLVDFQAITNRRAIFSIFYLLSGAGHQAVVIFFVLSGYLISGSIFRSLRRESWSWQSYLFQRLTRLWIVLIPALLLGACWDVLGLILGSAPSLYGGLVPNHTTTNVLSDMSLSVFLGNIVFLQTIVVPTFGSNGPLWSLANEFWYYVLFPLVLLTFKRSSGSGTRLRCVLLATLVAYFIGKAVLVLFPIWLGGVLLHRMRRFKINNRGLWLATGSYAVIFFLICFAAHHRSGKVYDVCLDLVLAVATVLLLQIALSVPREANGGMLVAATRLIARFSYTLYLCHFPFLLFCAGILVHDTRWYPTTRALLSAAAALILVILYSWYIAVLTEFRTDFIRNRLERMCKGIQFTRKASSPLTLPEGPALSQGRRT